jgi:pimeloyl-ACP methyl ester carboxylesterase
METKRHMFEAADGTRLAWHEAGPADGRPALLIHGLFSDAHTNWIRFGHAEAIAQQGVRLIMPDLRGHGTGARPHDPAAYPPDILAADGLDLVRHLGLADGGWDLGGYSLGARTAVRMAVLGARPGRLIVSGMGLAGLRDTERRAAHFRRILEGLGTHERGSPEWMAEAFLKTTGGDPKALLPLLSSFVDTTEAELAAIAVPTLVLMGSEDDDNGSGRAVADLLGQACYEEVPGNHMSCITRPEFGRAIAAFLAS